MMRRREVPALPTRLVNPRNKKQRRPQPSQPGLGEEQRLKGVEVAKLLRLHSQAPTASVGGMTVAQKWPIRNTGAQAQRTAGFLLLKGKIMLVEELSLNVTRAVTGQHFLH